MAENELDMALDLPEAVQRALDFPDEMERMLHPPARTYVKRAKAFLRTPADIYEYPDSYSFVLDMPGLEPNMIKVNVEDGRVLHVLGKRRKKPAAGEGEKKAQGETKEEGGEGATTTAERETKVERKGEAREQKVTAAEVPREVATAVEGKPIRIERKRVRYMRRFNLPRDADRDNVRATYRNGVLTVVVGKVPVKEPPPKPRAISIPVSCAQTSDVPET